MQKETESGGVRSGIAAVVLCASIALAALFSGKGVTTFLGPSQAELTQKKQAFRENRNLLLLQLSICQRNTDKAGDAYICPGSAMVYKSLGSGPDCLLAAEVAKELGIGHRDFTIARKAAPAVHISFKPAGTADDPK